ncbi:MAG TPA: hypothetical protein VFN94_07995 [Nitrospiria bacterium]|nr:hypothetical protein [Nitrospiria bacterium]
MATATIGQAQESPGTVPALAADLEQRVLSSDGSVVSVTTSSVLLTDAAARVESAGEPERAGYGEYHLYDFSRGRSYRIFPNDHIYFEAAWSSASAAKAFIEGWAPKPETWSVRMIPLKDDVLDGTPTHLSLLERRLKSGPAPAYAFVWNVVPAGRLPARVIYSQAGGQTVIVSYRRVESVRVDPSRFVVPAGFGNLSPF